MNNAPFHVGQKVVCVRTVRGSKYSVIKGSEYIVRGVRNGGCRCAEWLVDVGIRSDRFGDKRECIKCKNIDAVPNSNIIWVGSQNFAPIPPRSVSIPSSLKEQAEDMIGVKETIQEPEKEMA